MGAESTINGKCAFLRRQLLLQLFDFLELNSSPARLFKQDLKFFKTDVLQHILIHSQYYGLDLLMKTIITITARITLVGEIELKNGLLTVELNRFKTFKKPSVSTARGFRLRVEKPFFNLV